MRVSLDKWITLEQAEARGTDLSWVADAIGPRRTGAFYQSGYWGDMVNVLAVHVQLGTLRDYDGGIVGTGATWWQVTERSTGESRIRQHCTSWEYDSRNAVLHGPADLRR